MDWILNGKFVSAYSLASTGFVFVYENLNFVLGALVLLSVLALNIAGYHKNREEKKKHNAEKELAEEQLRQLKGE